MNTDLNHGMEAIYRAAVGPKNTDYYVSRFVRFDQPGASKVSWNWPACFIPFYWFLYRRMFGWAILCALIPISIEFAGTATSLLSLVAALIYLVTLFGCRYVVLPMYANALYHRKIRKRIAELSRKVANPAAQVVVLGNGPHTTAMALVILPFAFIAFLGIIAAIAIPAYQDHTIRAQVSEGLTLWQRA